MFMCFECALFPKRDSCSFQSDKSGRCFFQSVVSRFTGCHFACTLFDHKFEKYQSAFSQLLFCTLRMGSLSLWRNAARMFRASSRWVRDTFCWAHFFTIPCIYVRVFCSLSSFKSWVIASFNLSSPSSCFVQRIVSRFTGYYFLWTLFDHTFKKH